MNKKLIVAIFDGLGISTSFQGNALLSANPTNLNRLWRENEAILLKSRVPDISDTAFLTEPEINYSLMSSGTFRSPYYDKINQEIDRGVFVNHPKLNELFKHAASTFSSIHMVGHYSANNYYSDIRHLESIFEIARRNKFYKILLHLIIDDSFNDFNRLVESLNQLQSKVEKDNVAQIATLVGMKQTAEDNSCSKAYVNICIGNGKMSLSCEQALYSYARGLSNFSYLPPISLARDSKPLTRLSNFDKVVFFDHNPSPVERLIYAFIQGTSKGISDVLHMSEVFSLTDRLVSRNDRIVPLYSIHPQSTLPNFLRGAGVNCQLITETFSSDAFVRYFWGNDTSCVRQVNSKISTYKSDYPYIQEEMLKILIKDIDKSRCVFLYFPFLRNISRISHFSSAVTAVKVADKVIESLDNIANKYFYDMVITSSYGFLDNLVKDQEEINCLPTNAPVPLIFVNHQSGIDRKATDLANISPTEIINVRNTLYDFTPAICGLLGVSGPS